MSAHLLLSRGDSPETKGTEHLYPAGDERADSAPTRPVRTVGTRHGRGPHAPLDANHPATLLAEDLVEPREPPEPPFSLSSRGGEDGGGIMSIPPGFIAQGFPPHSFAEESHLSAVAAKQKNIAFPSNIVHSLDGIPAVTGNCSTPTEMADLHSVAGEADLRFPAKMSEKRTCALLCRREILTGEAFRRWLLRS
ncbi:hypothetical protein KSP40_PGU007320 [Platanthera guangdongensis]|uniref:Uncharacterized protein n=1 Tax=Platanthera guangdongensis TaxID=2320717 RepID=A0ABR2MLJ6_9ASPA